MEDNDKLLFEISHLVVKAHDNSISTVEFNRLQSLLRTDPVALEYYFDLLNAFASMDELPLVASGNNQMEYCNLLLELGEYEKTAPEIEMPHDNHVQHAIQKVIYPARAKRKVSKFNIFILLNTAAAILFIVIFLNFVPSQGVEVATLTDSIHAKWADVDGSMGIGTRLATNSDKLYLKEGLVELLFDNDAKVVIEGPAEFELFAEDRIKLNFGNIYSSVPPEAIGFSIFTQNAKIFDMGTEFGVEADFRGNTLLHVIKGSTMLVAGDQSNKKGIEVKKGAAKKITAVNSETSDISCDYNYFVRDIDSQGGMVWKGRNLSLASIVAGFDGFQEVDSLTSLDPLTGKHVVSRKENYQKTNNAYNLVADLKFIDGVFAPDGELGPVQITSLGHTFDCPDTMGVFTHEISAYKGLIENQHATITPVIMNGQEVTNEPVLMLHSNIGITFDLQAIRESLPQLNLMSFKATGVAKITHNPRLDFSVLIDGQIKYERKIETVDGDRDPISFNVEFSPEDRFLTLIVTDGLDNNYANDFFYLINPELCLTDRVGR